MTPGIIPWSQTQPAASSLQDIEQLVRQHISNNQQNLQQVQQSQPSAYTGPTMTEIRKDHSTSQDVSKIIDALKSVSPVFGQLSSNPPPTPTVHGISPLGQLQQLLDQQTNAQHQPPAPQHSIQDTIQQLQQQLLVQQAVPQNPGIQHTGGQLGALLGLPQSGLGLSQSGQSLLPQYQPTNNHGQDQLSQLISALLRQATPPPPPPPPPSNPISPVLLQQILQNPNLLLQLTQNPALLQVLCGLQDGSRSLVQAAQGLPARPGLMQAPQEKPSQKQLTKPHIQQLNQGMSSHGRAVHVRPTDYSKYCHVEYSEKVKPENANIVMFIYGYISQILASRQGLIAQMPESELVGRLQHLINLSELTAMYSTNSDFCSYAWQRARNYNSRIFSDLDLGNLTWSGIASKPDPTSMMQAIEAVPKPAMEQPRIKKVDEKKKTTPDEAPCPKWNNCEITGKCQLEVDNPTKKCSKPHICSYCYLKFGYTRTNHKEGACRKKEEDSSGSSQPSS